MGHSGLSGHCRGIFQWMPWYECVTGLPMDLRSNSVLQPLLLEKRRHSANAVTRRLSFPALFTCMGRYILRHLCTSYNSMAKREAGVVPTLVEHLKNDKYIYLYTSLHLGLSVIDSSGVDHEIGFYRVNVAPEQTITWCSSIVELL